MVCQHVQRPPNLYIARKKQSGTCPNIKGLVSAEAASG